MLFRSNQIPKVARGLGQGLREFKQAARDLQQDDDKTTARKDDKSEPPQPSG